MEYRTKLPAMIPAHNCNLQHLRRTADGDQCPNREIQNLFHQWDLLQRLTLWSRGLICRTPPGRLRRRNNYAETGKLYLRTLLDTILHCQGPRHHFTITSSQAARRRHRINSSLALPRILSNGVAWELKTKRKGVPPISECVCKAATCSAPRGEVLLR
jgi:hypothetical protein